MTCRPRQKHGRLVSILLSRRIRSTGIYSRLMILKRSCSNSTAGWTGFATPTVLQPASCRRTGIGTPNSSGSCPPCTCTGYPPTTPSRTAQRPSGGTATSQMHEPGFETGSPPAAHALTGIGQPARRVGPEKTPPRPSRTYPSQTATKTSCGSCSIRSQRARRPKMPSSRPSNLTPARCEHDAAVHTKDRAASAERARADDPRRLPRTPRPRQAQRVTHPYRAPTVRVVPLGRNDDIEAPACFSGAFVVECMHPSRMADVVVLALRPCGEAKQTWPTRPSPTAFGLFLRSTSLDSSVRVGRTSDCGEEP